MPDPVSPATGNTLTPIDLDPRNLAATSFAEFCDSLLAKLAAIKDRRFRWYDQQRDLRSRWVHGSRKALALAGAVAILLTALAAGLRVWRPQLEYDVWFLIIALVLYAAMGAVLFYEKITDATSAYFRHLGVILLIRDLWTKLQFELLKQFRSLKPGDAVSEAAVKEQICVLAEAFCRDLDKLASTELAQWQTEFMASLSELEAAARKGSDDATKQLGEAVKAIEKATADALKAAEEAAKPAYVKLKIQGDFDGKVTILVDDAQVAESHLRDIVLDRLRPGYRKFEARAKKGDADRRAVDIKKLAPDLQDLTLTLG